MKMKIVPMLSALTLTGWGALAGADPVDQKDARDSSAKAERIELTDTQMDGITAGQQSGLVNIDRVLNNNNVVVAIPVNANVAANVCVIARGCTITDPSAEQRPGRINALQ
jgi:uncharacterized protein (DUF3084 family)